MVAQVKLPAARDTAIAQQVIGPRKPWQSPAEYASQVVRVAALVALHRGPQREYRNERPGFQPHYRRDW